MAEWKTDTRLWKEYAVAREKYGKNSKKARARRRELKRIDEWNKPLDQLQSPIWDDLSKIGIKLGQEERRKALMDAKERSKAIYEEKKRWKFLPEQQTETFRFGEEKIDFKWDMFRPYDEDYNSYDGKTERAIFWHKMSEEEESSFREQFWVEFVDPYCDGRDCTEAPFTSWMKFLRCEDRTIVLHRINYDV